MTRLINVVRAFDRNALKLFVPILVLWLAPLLVFTALVNVPDHFERKATTSPVTKYVKIGSREDDPRVPVQIRIKRGADDFVTSPRSGVVTRVQTGTHGQIRERSRLVWINDRPVELYSGKTPFFRSLGLRSRGSDVLDLNQFLHRKGFQSSVGSNSFTNRTSVGVRNLQSHLGYTVDGIFRRRYVAFIPPGGDGTGAVVTKIGTSINIGDHIIRLRSRIVSVSLQAQDLKDMTQFAGRPTLLVVGQRNFHGSGGRLPSRSASAVAQAIEASGSSSNKSATGILRAARPKHFGAVPGTAVYTSESGTACLFLKKVGTDAAQGSRAYSLDPAIPNSPEIGMALTPASLIGRRAVADTRALSSKELATCS